MRGSISRLALAAGLLAAAPLAAGAEGFGPAPSSGLLTRYGEYFLLGGGVSDFTDGEVQDRFDPGGSWEARLGFGSRYFVGGEVAYVGSFRGASGAGSDLLSNGGEAVLRLQYPHVAGKWLVEPFAFGGIGWSRISLRDAPAGAEDSDDIGVVPFGAGLTLGHGRLLVDARFTYRTSFAEDLPVAAAGAPASFDQWGVSASIGYEF